MYSEKRIATTQAEVLRWGQARTGRADMTWQDSGACRTYSAEIFFPDNAPGHGHTIAEQRAKTICHGCPVLESCRRHALTLPEDYGIWGGLTPTERTRIRRRIERWSA